MIYNEVKAFGLLAFKSWERIKGESIMKKRRVPFLACVVILGILMWPVACLGFGFEDMDLHGWYDNQTAVRTQDGVNEAGDLSRFRNTLQLDVGVKFSDDLRFKAILRGYSEASWAIESGLNQAPRDLDSVPNGGTGMQWDADFREYYLTKYWGNDFYMKIGRQQVVWGETDLLRISDIINPLDMSWWINLQNWEDIRIPLRMINMGYNIPESAQDLRFEVVLNPEDFRPNNVAAPGANWDPTWSTWANNNPAIQAAGLAGTQTFWRAMQHDLHEKRPEFDFGNFQGGMRIMGNFGPWELGVFDYYAIAPDAVMTFNMAKVAETGVPLEFDWPNINHLGGTFNVFDNFTGAVFRGECAYTFNQPFNLEQSNPILQAMGISVASEYITKDTFSYFLGFDRPTWVTFLNPQKTFFISGQLFQKFIMNKDDRMFSTGFGEDGNSQSQTLASLLINTEYYNSRIIPEVVALYEFNADGGLVRAKVDYKPTVDTQFTLGYLYLWAKKDNSGMIGPFRENNEAFFEFKYFF